MKFIGNQKLLLRINRDVIFATFELSMVDSEFGYSIEADYFDYKIRVFSPDKQRKSINNSFYIRIETQFQKPKEVFYLESAQGSKEFTTFDDLLAIINKYIKSRPFTILPWGTGKFKYILLDPNGFDYTGEYITLRDAKRTCCNNFIRY